MQRLQRLVATQTKFAKQNTKFNSLFQAKQYNKQLYRFNNQEQDQQQQQQYKSPDEVINAYFQYKIYEINGTETRILTNHQLSDQEKSNFKRNVLTKTHISSMGVLALGAVLHIPTLYPLLAMTYVPKFFVQQNPDSIYKNENNELKFQYSKLQWAGYTGVSLCMGLVFNNVLQLSFGILPIFGFFSIYTSTLQKNNQLTELNCLKGIGAINFLFLLENLSAEAGQSIFWDSCGNNLFLLAYSFFISNQQKICDIALKYKYLDELNTIFASFRFQQLAYQQLTWKNKALILFIVIMFILGQLYLRSLRSVKSVALNEGGDHIDENILNRQKEEGQQSGQDDSQKQQQQENKSNDLFSTFKSLAEKRQQLKQKEQQQQSETSDQQYNYGTYSSQQQPESYDSNVNPYLTKDQQKQQQQQQQKQSSSFDSQYSFGQQSSSSSSQYDSYYGSQSQQQNSNQSSGSDYGYSATAQFSQGESFGSNNQKNESKNPYL